MCFSRKKLGTKGLFGSYFKKNVFYSKRQGDNKENRENTFGSQPFFFKKTKRTHKIWKTLNMLRTQF